jgi:hypothetical protein
MRALPAAVALVLAAAAPAAGSCPAYRPSATPPEAVEAPDDGELQRRWADFKDALGRRDVPDALECVLSVRRRRYEESLRALFVTNNTRVEDVLTSIRFVRASGRLAVYEMIRRQRGIDQSFEVRFGFDLDGVWRIESF